MALKFYVAQERIDMYTKFLMFSALLISVGFTTLAQDSIRVRPLPSDQTQPDPKEDRVEVDKATLPQKMTELLQREEKYNGWENSPVYFERNSNQYVIHVTRENSTQIFRFTKDGSAITTNAPVERQEDKN